MGLPERFNIEGKTPWEVDRLTGVFRIWEKMVGQDLITEYGMKSMDKDLEDMLMISRASSVVTVGRTRLESQ